MPQRATSTSFKPGDPRIWRGGRPKSFTALQELAQAIAHEKAKRDGGVVVAKDDEGKEHSLTVAEAILRQWAQSKNPALQQKFIEVAFGKVPNITQLQGHDGKEIVVRFEPSNRNAATTDETTGDGN